VLWSACARAQTPAPWRAFDISTGNDNTTRLIWRTPDNGFVVWNLTDGGQNNASSPVFGPISDANGSWSPVKLGVGGDGLTRLLLTRSDGTAAVWTLNSNLTFGSSTPAYGPYSGSTCVDMAVARDNSLRLLWTTSNGSFGLWSIAPGGLPVYSPTFGPYGDASGTWSARKIGIGGDGLVRILLSRSDGQSSVWTLDGAMNFASSSSGFGPYTNLNAAALALNTASTSDNTRHLMWKRSDGQFVLWRLSPNDALTVPSALEVNATFGPYVNISAQALSVGGDGQMRVLLNYTDGRAVFWKLSTDGQQFPPPVNVTFGPLPQATPTPTPTPTATPTPTPTPLPLLSVSNASVNEGNSGLTPLPFVASLSSASSQNVTFSYSTVAGTATADVDYVSASGTFTIPAGQTSATVNVSINGDTTVEPNETLTLTLSGIVGARLASGTTVSATGTIINDDVAPTPTPTPTATPDPNAVQAPTNLYVVSTGNGKNTLYWRQVPNVVGYYVYRSTSSGSENYSTPLGSAMVLSQASYSGSPMQMWTDTGLTNGTEYFYTVKSATAASSSSGTQSSPSNEDSDVVDPQGTQWDSLNTSLILSAATSALDATAPPGATPVEGGEAFEVTGPDGVTYISGQAEPQLPTVLYDPITKGYMLPDGTPFAMSSGEDIVNFSSNLVRSEEIGGNVLGGAYRGAITTTGYYACMFQIQLPTVASNNVYISPDGKIAHDDHPVVYLGSSATDARGGAGVDAGLMYGASKDDNPPNSKWHFYLRSFGGANTPTYSNIVFNPGEIVSLLYCLERRAAGRSNKIYAALTIKDFSNGRNTCKAVQVGHHNRDFSNVKVKRNEQMAQEEKGANGSHNGQPIIGSHIELDGSYMLGFDWFDGQVFPYSSPGHLWGLSDTPSTGVASWPNSSISYYDQTHSHPYDVESNVCINLSNPMG